MLAQSLLLATGDASAAQRWLPGLASGAVRGAVAFGGRAPSTAAARDGAGWRLDGAENQVIDGHTAELLLVVADTDDGPSVSHRCLPAEPPPQVEALVEVKPVVPP